MANNWPIENTAEDYFRQTRKRLDRIERIAAPISVADLMGPGMSSQAVNILDWNDEIATFNGFYYSFAGSYNAPVVESQAINPDTGMPEGPVTVHPAMAWTGQVIAREDGTGMQQVWNTDEPEQMYFRVRNYWPNPDDPEAPVVFGDWQKFATPTGFVDGGDLAPPVQEGISDAFENAKEALDKAEEAIGLVPPKNHVYYQTTPPTNPDINGRALIQGDFWFDTDDGNRQWTFNGTGWVDPATAILAAGATDAQAAAAAAKAGLDKATEAIGIANAVGDTYYTPTKPTGGTYTTADTWIDTDDGNKPYRWTGTPDWTPVLTGWVQTDAANTRGIKITTTGLLAYSNGTIGKPDGSGAIPANTATFAIDGTTGEVYMLGSLTSGSAVTGATVTGGTVQTSATSLYGIKMTSGGFLAYGPNPAGGANIVTTYIDANSGVLSTTGGLLTGGQVVGATVTASSGGVIQTESTDLVGVKMNSRGLACYATGEDYPGTPGSFPRNTKTFSVLTSSGQVQMLGPLVSGGDIQGATVTGGIVQTDTAASGVARAVLEKTQVAGTAAVTGNLGIYYGSTYVGGVFAYGSGSSTVAALVGGQGAAGPMIFTFMDGAILRGKAGAAVSCGDTVVMTGPVNISQRLDMGGAAINAVSGINNGNGAISVGGVLTLNSLGINSAGPLNAVSAINNGGGNISMNASVTATGAWTATQYTMTGNNWSAGGTALYVGAGGLIKTIVNPSLREWKRDVTPLPVDLDSLGALGRKAITFRYRDDIDLPFEVDDFNETFYGVDLDLATELGGLDLLIGNDENGDPFQFLPDRLPIALLAGYGDLQKRVTDIEARLRAAGL